MIVLCAVLELLALVLCVGFLWRIGRDLRGLADDTQALRRWAKAQHARLVMLTDPARPPAPRRSRRTGKRTAPDEPVSTPAPEGESVE
ncbi:MAG TPA: hypothetical protein PKJ99_12245 [Thermoanaerobaculales bacterium]|nr:hypothetical protein [Thermoanaerobaculales bacterium]